MGFGDLFWRHLFHNFFLADRRVRIAADRREDVPGVRANQIRRGHAATDLIVPANAGLCTGMALKRRPQIPVECTNIVAFDAKPHGVHDTDQLFRIGIARSRCRQKLLHGLGKLTLFHKIARGLNFRLADRRKYQHDRYEGRPQKFPHARTVLATISILLPISATPAMASSFALPQPLSDEDFHPVDRRQVELGRFLFFDPILSGNRNISCGTCHSPEFGTSDGLALGIGEGGQGVGPDRTVGSGPDRIRKRIPRNSPGLWNLGAKEVRILFHDGRLSVSDIYGNGFNSPAEEWLPNGLETILAAQALFPLTSQFEMAGNPKENQVAGAAHDRIDAVWPIIAKRVRTIPEYASLFQEAFDDVHEPLDITIVHIGNVLGAFMAFEWRSADSRFDRFLAGETDALNETERAGMALFFGPAGCSTCHSGKLFTDHDFHALALPHFGPGRTRRFDPYVRDVGRPA